MLSEGDPKQLSDLSFSTITSLMGETSYGKILNERVRWGSYKPESITTSEWVNILGADVHNFKHMRFMRGFTDLFIYYCNTYDTDTLGRVTFTDRERYLLLLTATVHDYAESVIGDIPAPLKNEDDDHAESELLLQLMKEVLHVEETPDDLLEVQKIMKDKTTKLGHAWRCIEDLGYVRAGIVAYSKLKKVEKSSWNSRFSESQQKDIRLNLETMAFRVFQRELPKHLSDQNHGRYAAVDKILDIWSPIISDAIINIDAEIATDIFMRTDPSSQKTTRNEVITSYLESKYLWSKYMQSKAA